jgi:hypothetical protein
MKLRLWTALAEKAYAQINEMGWLRNGFSGSAQNSYSAIDSGYIYVALGQITGQGTLPFNSTGARNQCFENAYNREKSIGFTSLAIPSRPRSLVGTRMQSSDRTRRRKP